MSSVFHLGFEFPALGCPDATRSYRDLDEARRSVCSTLRAQIYLSDGLCSGTHCISVAPSVLIFLLAPGDGDGLWCELEVLHCPCRL